MRSFHKLFLITALGAFAGVGALAKDGDDKAEKKKKDDRKEEKKGDKKEKGKGEKGEKGDAAAENGPTKLTVPVPPGHHAKGLVIPYRDARGNMQMRFTMDVGSRTDADHMEMKKLLIETFDPDGKEEMTIELPESKLNLTSRIITTQSGVVIKREDFELAGQTMEFNTATREGRLGGKVRMLIYNLENETNAPEEAAPNEK